MMSERHYTKFMGTYYLKKGKQTMYGADRVAIGYSVTEEEDGTKMYVVHKHGSEEMIRKWHKDTVQKCNNAGYPDFGSEFRILMCENWDLEVLNKIINNSGYIGKVIEENLTGIGDLATMD